MLTRSKYGYKLFEIPVKNGRPLSFGRRTRLHLVVLITNANTNRFFMAGVKAVSTIGVVRGIRVMSGSLINQSRMTYTQL